MENPFIVKAAFRGNLGLEKEQNSWKTIDLCTAEYCDH